MKRTVGAILAVALAIGGGLLTWHFTNSPVPPPPAPTVKIVLGIPRHLGSAPVCVGEKMGYFAAQGLDVQIANFDSGGTALKVMLEQGGLDMVVAAQTPVVFRSFASSDYAIIAGTAQSTDDLKLLGRRDAGVASAADLHGKRVGITKGTTGHYFLSAFLAAKGMRMADIATEDVKAGEIAQALADGRVAVIATWEPYAFDAGRLVGANAVVFDSQGLFRQDIYFVASKSLISRNPQSLVRFLKAIDRANRYLATNEADAIAISSQCLKIERSLVEALWKIYNFRLFLDESILLSLEDQARWAMENAVIEGRAMPNYLDFIYLDALETAKPTAVTLIH